MLLSYYQYSDHELESNIEVEVSDGRGSLMCCLDALCWVYVVLIVGS